MENREAFASIVQNAFEVLDVARIEHWVVSEEEQEDEGKLSAFPTHFHMAVKLTRRGQKMSGHFRACLPP